ncbi:hypothetical protein DSCOOX_13200 [Desulfosarcina ovata subsp. ovata]|uniref:Uncharacterized protein n=1 Tax=Desulfosarcina ovata subsp. ovata TaxID=2752305 RepID=A0A5K8A7V3_9BACT|nr:hypothetical protein DSCOOX_13200 [Desulfosarcina ovata subsp. ovata]
MVRLTGVRPIFMNREKAASKSVPIPKQARAFRFSAASQWRCRDADNFVFHLPLDRRCFRQSQIVKIGT